MAYIHLFKKMILIVRLYHHFLFYFSTLTLLYCCWKGGTDYGINTRVLCLCMNNGNQCERDLLKSSQYSNKSYFITTRLHATNILYHSPTYHSKKNCKINGKIYQSCNKIVRPTYSSRLPPHFDLYLKFKVNIHKKIIANIERQRDVIPDIGSC